jgi:D-serine deaminase-like pyridoxal phosphate-dependent protein
MADLWQTLVNGELDTPLVVVHRERLLANIEDMAKFAGEQGVVLRPHVKTHKTWEIAQMQLSAGAAGLTCAKLGEAEAFLQRGAKSVLVAYPLVGKRKVERLFDLMARFPEAEVQTLVDSSRQVDELAAEAAVRGVQLPLWVKVDSGLRRCGVQPGLQAVELARHVKRSPGLLLLGLLTHAGHAYGAASYEQVQEIGRSEAQCLLETAAMLRAEGVDGLGISVGSTPTVKVSGAVEGVTEIRPGNYVFYDATQVRLGVVAPERCALRVFAQVVSRPEAGRIVIDAGAKTLALDKGAHGSDAVSGYGMIVGHEQAVIERLSEEHGVVRIPEASGIAVGDVLEIIPNHSCPVVNLTDELCVVNSDGSTESWQVVARGKTR